MDRAADEKLSLWKGAITGHSIIWACLSPHTRKLFSAAVRMGHPS